MALKLMYITNNPAIAKIAVVPNAFLLNMYRIVPSPFVFLGIL